MYKNILMIKEIASCRCQAFVRGINKGIDATTFILPQAFLCPPTNFETGT